MTIKSSAILNDLEVATYQKDILNQLFEGTEDYELRHPDVWSQSHRVASRQSQERKSKKRATTAATETASPA